MEEGYTSKSTKTSTSVVNGTTTKVVTTTMSKPDGTTKTITETTVTKPDGSSSVSTQTKTENIPAGSGGGAPKMSGAPSAGTPAKPPVDIHTFRDQALKAHNDRRAKHGVPALTLSKELNDFAQNWADHLISSGKFAHSDCTMGDKRLGENIANRWASNGADYNGEEVTEQWYSEISKHDYNKDHQPGTGHFTQVVWKGSQEMGIGKAQDGKGKVICVGSYFPAGNLIGSWSQNVFPPK